MYFEPLPWSNAPFFDVAPPFFDGAPVFVFLCLCVPWWKGWLMFLTWTDHVQERASELGLSLGGGVRGLLAGSSVVRRLGNRVRDGLNLA